jgi:hypothetical protein
LLVILLGWSIAPVDENCSSCTGTLSNVDQISSAEHEIPSGATVSFPHEYLDGPS